MLNRIAALSLLFVTVGCSDQTDTRHHSIYFAAYSAVLDREGRQSVHEIASVARANPALPVLIAGFAAPADPARQVDGLSAQRADAVRQVLIEDGVGPDRIITQAHGITDPKTLPSVAVRRVDISVGP